MKDEFEWFHNPLVIREGSNSLVIVSILFTQSDSKVDKVNSQQAFN
ncbi:hypothetical protein XBJ2_1130003 [Xenorhabdus bovienii str. Jollieti]|nr:hypothetical protein XBJ2_1130003 [Xenorhabdus bovienii str. Jollieti]